MAIIPAKRSRIIASTRNLDLKKAIKTGSMQLFIAEMDHACLYSPVYYNYPAIKN